MLTLAEPIESQFREETSYKPSCYYYLEYY